MDARRGDDSLNRIAALVKGSRSDAADKVRALLDENRRLGRELAQVQEKLAANQGSDLVDEAVDVAGVKVLAARVEGDSKALMQTLDTLKSKLGTAAVVLGHVGGGKVSLIAGVSKDLTDRIKAPDLVNAVGAQVGAKGGGRPDMARAGGGDNPDALTDALASVPDLDPGPARQLSHGRDRSEVRRHQRRQRGAHPGGCCERVQRYRAEGHQVLVVVSAMSGETNRLESLGRSMATRPPAREMDVLLSSGEQVTIALLSMALQELGVPAKSYLGDQVCIRTDGNFRPGEDQGDR